MQLTLFTNIENIPKITIEEIFEAYFQCRHNKRNTINALAFEVDYESNLVTLLEEINNGSYKSGKSITFIVNKPVTREIFAADFRDRVVHHLIINKLNPLFEKEFIYDSYACRTGKGTHFGIKRIDHFIRKCSENYTKDCYILKLDIKGFFMHIDKNILFERLKIFINEKYKEGDKELLLELCRKIIYNNPTEKCVIKGKLSNWDDLPHDKSLFYSPPDCGLPIGNLSSQVFANFYMSMFDHYIKHDLGIKYYGRYVDDFIIVCSSKEQLKSFIPQIKDYLKIKLCLALHPKKIYFQHYIKGVQYLGVVIKQSRIYVATHTKNNFSMTIDRLNIIARDHKPTKEEKDNFLSSMNSYLGIMGHYKTYYLRKRILVDNLSGWWWNYVYLSGGVGKFVLKQRIFPHVRHVGKVGVGLVDVAEQSRAEQSRAEQSRAEQSRAEQSRAINYIYILYSFLV